MGRIKSFEKTIKCALTESTCSAPEWLIWGVLCDVPSDAITVFLVVKLKTNQNSVLEMF